MMKRIILLTCVLVVTLATIWTAPGYAQGWVYQTSCDPSQNLYGVHFVDTTEGWAVGSYGTICRTTNGGTNWSSQTSGTTLQLCDVDGIVDFKDFGWAVGASGKILRTTDGGTTWIDESDPSVTTSRLWGVSFADVNNGWAVGEGGTIIHTTDGGQNWVKQTSGVTKWLKGVFAYNSDTVWACGKDGVVLKTTNGGTSWTSQYLTGGHCLNSIIFPENPLEGWTGGRFGYIFHTTNGGATWPDIQFGTPGDRCLKSGPFFTDNQHGWGVGKKERIVYTINGGDDWIIERDGTVDDPDLWDIHVVESGGLFYLWAVGDGATILHKVGPYTEGSVDGYVYEASGKGPIEGAVVKVEGASRIDTTDVNGYYLIDHVSVGTYCVSATAPPYYPDTICNVGVLDGQTTRVDFYLNWASIQVDPDSFAVNVELGDTLYDTLVISNTGIAPLDFDISVSTHAKYATTEVQPFENCANSKLPPEGACVAKDGTPAPRRSTPQLVDYPGIGEGLNSPKGDVILSEGFEGSWPPSGWTVIQTNADNTHSIPGWWSQTNYTVHTGSYAAGLWWSYYHQDEWLITPEISIAGACTLSFWTYGYKGSTHNDHYYVKVSTDGGSSWNVEFDLSAFTPPDTGWNGWTYPFKIDLSGYAGQNIKIAWHAEDPPSNDGLWYIWAIDDVTVECFGPVWLTVDPSIGTVLPGDSMKIEVIFTPNTSLVKDTTYTGEIQIHSNSVNNPMVIIPVEMTTGPAWIRGDANGDKVIDIGDVVYLINYLYRSGPPPDPLEAGNANGDGVIDIGDVVYLINYLYRSGPPPPPCPKGPSGYQFMKHTNGQKAEVSLFSSDLKSQEAVLEIEYQSPSDVAGAHIELNYDPDRLEILGISSTPRSEKLDLYHHCENGKLTLGLVDLKGENYIPSGKGSLVTLRIKSKGKRLDLSSLSIKKAVLVDAFALKFDVLVKDASLDFKAPVSFALSQNYPNPFNPKTEIGYALPEDAYVELVIFDILGRKVRTLVSEHQKTGTKSVHWDGKDNCGNRVSSGIYFYKIQAGNYAATKKMLMLK